MPRDEKSNRVSLRGFNVASRIHAARGLARHIQALVGHEITPVLLREISEIFREQLGLSEKAPVEELLAGFFNLELTAEMSRRMALRAIANKPALVEGVSPRPWDRAEPIWTCVKIVMSQPVLVREKRAAVAVEILCLSGAAAGELLVFNLGRRYVYWLLQELGAPRYGRSRFKDLVGMILWARLGHNRYGRFHILEARATDRQRKLNREELERKINNETQRAD